MDSACAPDRAPPTTLAPRPALPRGSSRGPGPWLWLRGSAFSPPPPSLATCHIAGHACSCWRSSPALPPFPWVGRWGVARGGSPRVGWEKGEGGSSFGLATMWCTCPPSPFPGGSPFSPPPCPTTCGGLGPPPPGLLWCSCTCPGPGLAARGSAFSPPPPSLSTCHMAGHACPGPWRPSLSSFPLPGVSWGAVVFGGFPWAGWEKGVGGVSFGLAGVLACSAPWLP